MHKEFPCPIKINDVQLAQQKPLESKSIPQLGCILNQRSHIQNSCY